MKGGCGGCEFKNDCKIERALNCELALRSAIDAIYNDDMVSAWLKDALRQSLTREPIDAWVDADILATVLKARMQQSLGNTIPDYPWKYSSR